MASSVTAESRRSARAANPRCWRKRCRRNPEKLEVTFSTHPEHEDLLLPTDPNKILWDRFLKWIGQQYGPAALLIVTEADIERAFHEGLTPALQEEIVTRLYAKNKETAEERALELQEEKKAIEAKQKALAIEKAGIDAAMNHQNIRLAQEELKEIQKRAVEVKAEEIRNEIDLEITQLTQEALKEVMLTNKTPFSDEKAALILLKECEQNYWKTKYSLLLIRWKNLWSNDYQEEKEAFVLLTKQQIKDAEALVIAARKEYLKIKK